MIKALAYSLDTHWAGVAWIFLAMIVAIPLGYAIGMSPVLGSAATPFVQILKAHLTIGVDADCAFIRLKTLTHQDIFVIFICSIWPRLPIQPLVASVRRDGVMSLRRLSLAH